MNTKVMFSSACDHYSTPKDVYDKLHKEFNFDFDPCPLGGFVGGMHDGESGIGMAWGRSNYVNPPYSEIKLWAEECYRHYKLGQTVVMLIPSRTDTRWWHDYIMKATDIRFIKGRLKFGGAKNCAPFPSCIVVFKPKGKNVSNL